MTSEIRTLRTREIAIARACVGAPIASPPAMTPRPHDALFKATFGVPEHAIALFRAVLPPAVFASLDWRELRVESASFVDAELADHHGDLLFSIRRTDGSGRVLLYVLVEHQSAPDAAMPLRLLGYLVQIWEREHREHSSTPLPFIISIVFSHAPDGWTTPRSLDELFAPDLAAVTAELADYLPRFRILVEDISRMTDDEIRARIDGAAAQLVWRLLRDARDPRRLIASVDDWPELYDEIGRRAPRTVAHIQRYVDHMAEPPLVDAFRAKLLSRAPIAGDIAMRWSEILQKESREQGIVQGQRATLRQLLEARFGELTPELAAKLDAALPDALERYTKRLLAADSAAAVLAD